MQIKYNLKLLITVLLLLNQCTLTTAQTPVIVNDQCGNIEPHHMVTDINGNIIVTGMMTGSIDFDPSAGVMMVYSNGINTTMYVAKYSASGTILWAFGLPTGGSTQFAEYPTALQVDASGNIYIAGIFHNNNLDMDPGPGVHIINLMSQLLSPARFFAKYSAAGNYIYAYSLGDHTTIADMAIDQYANLFLTGTTDGDDVAPNAQVVSVPLQVSRERVLIKVDSAANFHWARTYTQSQFSNPAENSMINIDQNGDLIICGPSTPSQDFDPDSTITYLLPYHNAFIAKYDSSDGSFIWARPTLRGGAAIFDLKITMNNTILITGRLNGANVDFNPDTLQNAYFATNGLWDAYLAKYNSNGDYLWTKTFGADENDYGIVLNIDVSGNIFLSGAFDSDSVDFDPGPGTSFVTRPDMQQRSVFLAVYDSIGQHIKSFGIESMDFGEAVSTQNAIGLNNDIIITGNFDDPDYNIDFDPGPATIGGQGCSLGAYIVKYGTQFLSVPDNSSITSIHVYPNPVTDHFNLEINALSTSGYILNMTDVSGKLVFSKSVNLQEGANLIRQTIQSVPDGMYFLQLVNNQVVKTMKILKM